MIDWNTAANHFMEKTWIRRYCREICGGKCCGVQSNYECKMSDFCQIKTPTSCALYICDKLLSKLLDYLYGEYVKAMIKYIAHSSYSFRGAKTYPSDFELEPKTHTYDFRSLLVDDKFIDTIWCAMYQIIRNEKSEWFETCDFCGEDIDMINDRPVHYDARDGKIYHFGCWYHYVRKIM